jgi:hypothetical protein
MGIANYKNQLKFALVQGPHRPGPGRGTRGAKPPGRKRNLAIVNLFFMDFLQEKVTRIQMYETK